MARMESMIKSEIVRLSSREVRKVLVPLRRDVRLLKGLVSQLRKSVLVLQRFGVQQERQRPECELPLAASPEEMKKARFSPGLIRSLRKRLGITQKELAVLAGVTVGAAHLWETGKFLPSDEKRGVIVALRKLTRREVRKLLEDKALNR